MGNGIEKALSFAAAGAGCHHQAFSFLAGGHQGLLLMQVQRPVQDLSRQGGETVIQETTIDGQHLTQRFPLLKIGQSFDKRPLDQLCPGNYLFYLFLQLGIAPADRQRGGNVSPQSFTQIFR